MMNTRRCTTRSSPNHRLRQQLHGTHATTQLRHDLRGVTWWSRIQSNAIPRNIGQYDFISERFITCQRPTPPSHARTHGLDDVETAQEQQRVAAGSTRTPVGFFHGCGHPVGRHKRGLGDLFEQVVR